MRMLKLLYSQGCSHSAVAILDDTLSFKLHIADVFNSCFYHHRKISGIRKYLTRDATEIVIHAFVTSKLDYCDSLYHGLPWFLSPELQAVQNSEI